MQLPDHYGQVAVAEWLEMNAVSHTRAGIWLTEFTFRFRGDERVESLRNEGVFLCSASASQAGCQPNNAPR